jgi:hypothetical protein
MPAAENGHGKEQTVFWGCNAARGRAPSVHALILMGGWNAAQRIQACENQVRQTISTTGNTVGGGATSCRLAELAQLTKSG